ncbi:MAG: dihydrodipicolinate synthase family protein [Clostridioides sp.]|jgi:4-hydroxy-tetrahydrodipicolinate synthase|nr:dihydrodipicolinate synthase family protein [Clostridioides sp.]
MKKNKLAGVNPPVVTIYTIDGKIDMEANYKHADFLISKGVDGLAYFGTSGEFSLLTLEEKKQYIKDMATYVNHRVNVIAGVGDTCLANVKEMIQAAEEADVDGLLLVNPYFSVYAESMVEKYYDTVADMTKLPIIIYNFPGLTGFDFNTELVKRLAKKHSNIVGIKETVGDTEHIRSMLTVKEVSPDFCVYSAFECQVMSVLPLGVEGFIGATVNFAPEFTVGTFRAYAEGNLEEAMEYAHKMNLAMDIYYCSNPLYLACKEAVYQRVLGEDNHAERLPAMPLDADAKKKVADVMSKLGF